MKNKIPQQFDTKCFGNNKRGIPLWISKKTSFHTINNGIINCLIVGGTKVVGVADSHEVHNWSTILLSYDCGGVLPLLMGNPFNFKFDTHWNLVASSEISKKIFWQAFLKYLPTRQPHTNPLYQNHWRKRHKLILWIQLTPKQNNYGKYDWHFSSLVIGKVELANFL